jgi:hypothetical protein
MALNKEYRFFIINKGEKDGVEEDKIYIVFAQGNKIAKAKSDNVYESMAVFDILEESGQLSEGMQVELLKE